MLEAGLTGSEGEEIRPKPKSDASSRFENYFNVKNNFLKFS